MGLPTSESGRRTAILQVLNAAAVGGWRGGDVERREMEENFLKAVVERRAERHRERCNAKELGSHLV